MRRSLLVIAAAFAAGLGLGYVLKPAPTVDRAARPAPAAEVSPVVGAEPALGEATPLSEPLPDLPRGDGRIRGRVLDDAGAPLADALVVATPVDPGTPRKGQKGPAGPADQDLDEMARQVVSKERWLREGRHSARTGEDGAYEIAGLGAIKWTLQAYKEGYQLRPTGDNAYGAEPGAVVDFAGGRIVRVDVDVRLPDGSVPATASIQARVQTQGGSTSSNETWLASEPWIELRPQPYELTAMTEGAKSRPQTVTIEARSGQTLLFQLEDRPALRVRVILPDDLPTVTPDVMAMRFAGAKPPEAARLRKEGERRSGPRRSEVTWQDLEPGSYLIGAAYSSDAPVVVTKVVEVRTGIAEHELRLPPVNPKDYLTVRVRGPEGDPPGPLQFTLTYRSSHHRSGNIVKPLARRDGAYLLRRWSPEQNDADGAHLVVAECSLGRVEQTYDPTDEREILIRFEPPAFVNVTVPGYATSPHAGWLGLALAVRDETGRSNRLHGNKPQAQGTCRLGPVQPGSYELVLHASPETWTVSALPVELRSGEQAATIDVPALHTLTVRWPGTGKRVFGIERKDIPYGRIRREVTEESTTVERMAKGVYEIRWYGDSKEVVIEVEIPRQTEVTIK